MNFNVNKDLVDRLLVMRRDKKRVTVERMSFSM